MEKNTKIIISMILLGGIFIFAFLTLIFFKKSGAPAVPSSTAIATSPQPSTEGEINYQKPKEADEFLKKNPLVKYLPYYNEHFKVEYSVNDKMEATYKITLRVALNNTNQFDIYKEIYAQYKLEALDWILSKKVDYKTLNIKWEPEDPKNINFNSQSSNSNSNCSTCH